MFILMKDEKEENKNINDMYPTYIPLAGYYSLTDFLVSHLFIYPCFIYPCFHITVQIANRLDSPYETQIKVGLLKLMSWTLIKKKFF